MLPKLASLGRRTFANLLQSAASSKKFTGPSRYITQTSEKMAAFKVAAEEYPNRVPEEDKRWMMRKPLDANRGHPYTCHALYAVLNILQLLRLSPGSKIIEVGSGSGWLTELLLGLGHHVIAIEPSPAMVDVARERIARFEKKFDMSLINNVTFEVCTIEEMEVSKLAAVDADAILFYESLHHVIDEERALQCAYQMLGNGGFVVNFGEARWRPGNTELEQYLQNEMARYGTLESPYTRKYLHYLLEKTGFENIKFYHSVNGLFSEDEEYLTIRHVSIQQGKSSKTENLVVAQRPSPKGLRIVQNPEHTSASIIVDRTFFAPDGALEIDFRLRNTGKTAWPANQRVRGEVKIALLESDSTGSECPHRYSLPHAVSAAEELSMSCRFQTDGRPGPFNLTLVSEGCFWFNDHVTISR